MIALSLLALAIAVTGILFATSMRTFRSIDTITVTGMAKKEVISDFIVWRGLIVTEDAKMQKAYEDSKKNVDAMNAFFLKNSIDPSAVTILPPNSTTLHQQSIGGSGESKVIGYRYTQSFEVRSKEVRRIEMLSKQVSELIERGIRLESYAPEYLITKFNDYREELYAEAIKDAKHKAEKIAEEVGKKVVEMLNAKSDVFQVTKRETTEISERGKYDTSTFEKEVMATVSAVFKFK